MTNPTPHGQVPEALIDLIDAYAETRHRCGGIYNAKTEAARNAAPQPAPAPLMPRGGSAAAQLRAMATNYPPGHLWDKLDAKACIKGALEIEALRAALAAQGGQ